MRIAPRGIFALTLLLAACRGEEPSVPGPPAEESPPVEQPPERLESIGTEIPRAGAIEPPGGAGVDVGLLDGPGPDASALRVLGSDAGAGGDAAIVVPERASRMPPPRRR